MSQTSPTLLVTGASGHLGRRVVELLLEAQAGTIIAATRTPEKLADFSTRGVIVRSADFKDPGSLTQAFAGVDRLLLISTDSFDNRLEYQRAAVNAADAAGVRHVIYTSIPNAGPDSPIAATPSHYGTEQALEASRMGYTILRNNIYTDLFLWTLPRAVQTGQLFSASGDGRTGYVTREDCARAAAAALASSFEGRRILTLTGPESLSQTDIARIASDLSGQPVTYIPLTTEQMIQGMVASGMPQPVAELYSTFDLGTSQGYVDIVTNDFEELTGRKPTSVADFLAAHRDGLLQAAPAG